MLASSPIRPHPLPKNIWQAPYRHCGTHGNQVGDAILDIRLKVENIYYVGETLCQFWQLKC